LETSFINNGIGMSKESSQFKHHFFTTKARRIGLGLPICKRIIEAHKGKISVKSEIGKGTTFTITIPKTLKKKKAKRYG